MPFFVAVDQQIPSHALDRTLTTIEADFATSRALHPGRRHTRVFQRLNRPGHLLTIGEWEHPGDYERLRQTPGYHETVIAADPPGKIEPLTRLRYFARMSTRPGVVACVTMTAPEGAADALRAYVLGETHQRIEQSPGLVMHEVFQVKADTGALLAIHSWRSLRDLERFRADDGPAYTALLAERGVAVTRFTGLIAAQFSRFEESGGSAYGVAARRNVALTG
jgi:quinol monooxygenase YgiN